MILPSLQPLREVGSLITNLGAQIVQVHSGTVISNNVAPSATIVALDTSPQDYIPARSICGRLPAGARVVLLAYPPRGLIVMGRMDEFDASVFSPLVYGPGVSAFTSNDVKGALALRVRVWGPGGAGSGAVATAAGQSSGGGGGGSGGYSESVLAVSALTFPVPLTIGTGGVPVLGAAGGNGSSNSSFGTYVTAGPGGGGGVSFAGVTVQPEGGGGNFGAAGVGQFATNGQYGEYGFRLAATVFISGSGAGAPMGGPGGAKTTSGNNGVAGSVPGGGGSAGDNGPSSAAKTGGAGGAGRIIVERLYR